jgi:hypothetical protein
LPILRAIREAAVTVRLLFWSYPALWLLLPAAVILATR